MIERLRVRVPAGAAREFSFPASTFCTDSFRYPVHSVKRVGDRLQLNTCTLCMTMAQWVCSEARNSAIVAIRGSLDVDTLI